MLARILQPSMDIAKASRATWHSALVEGKSIEGLASDALNALTSKVLFLARATSSQEECRQGCRHP